MNPYFGFFFATTTLIIAIPTAIKVYNWVLTLWQGDIHLTVPMLFAIGFIFTFVHGGLTGLFLGNVTVDLPLSDTYFVVGHFHMVMGVSPILVVFGAIYHWYPKITGRMWNDRLGRIHFWLTFLGTYAIYLPMHYLGILGVPRRYYALGDTEFLPESVHTINAAITIAAIVVAGSVIIFLVQHDREPVEGREGAAESLGRDDARVADAGHAAEARQLGAAPARRLSLGLRLQRARRAGGLHPAERAGRCAPRDRHRPRRRLGRALSNTAIVVALLVGDRGLVRGREPADGQALGQPRAGRRRRRAALVAAAHRPVGVHGGRHLAVRAVPDGVLDAHAPQRRLVPPDHPEHPVVQHGVLLAASVAMQFAANAAGDGRREFARNALVAAGALSIAFLAGQVLAWRAVGPSLYFVQGSPAIAFFYVLTIVHGLHLVGGLYVLGRSSLRFARGAELVDLRQSLSLCATYWHFLLLVWLAVFGVLLFL